MNASSFKLPLLELDGNNEVTLLALQVLHISNTGSIQHEGTIKAFRTQNLALKYVTPPNASLPSEMTSTHEFDGSVGTSGFW